MFMGTNCLSPREEFRINTYISLGSHMYTTVADRPSVYCVLSPGHTLTWLQVTASFRKTPQFPKCHCVSDAVPCCSDHIILFPENLHPRGAFYKLCTHATLVYYTIKHIPKIHFKWWGKIKTNIFFKYAIGCLAFFVFKIRVTRQSSPCLGL